MTGHFPSGTKKWIVALAFFLLPSVSSSAGKITEEGNILQNWIRLSLIGKDQGEIEFFFKDIPKAELEKVKGRLRGYVLSRLRSRNIHGLLKNASDMMDMRSVIHAIREEIRYFGLEDDNLLKYEIKEEFGISPFKMTPDRTTPDRTAANKIQG